MTAVSEDLQTDCRQLLFNTQLLVAIFLILLEIIGLGIGIFSVDIQNITGAGIWCGVLFLLTSIAGLKKLQEDRTAGTNYWNFHTTLNVVSLLLGLAMASFGIAALIFGNLICVGGPGSPVPKRTCNGFLIIRGLSVVFYIIMATLALISASINCCSRRKDEGSGDQPRTEPIVAVEKSGSILSVHPDPC